MKQLLFCLFCLFCLLMLSCSFNNNSDNEAHRIIFLEEMRNGCVEVGFSYEILNLNPDNPPIFFNGKNKYYWDKKHGRWKDIFIDRKKYKAFILHFCSEEIK